MRMLKELAISTLFFLALALGAASFPILYSASPGNFNMVFGTAFAFCVSVPIFVIPIAKSVKSISIKKERSDLVAYWAATLGFVLYGYFYDSSEPALNDLIFTWLLFVWVIGLPTLLLVSLSWHRSGD